jgi:tRNA G10  N-methylase Trm11
VENVRHPAKYTNSFLPIFAEILKGKRKIIDPMAGTGKIGKIKEFGFEGIVYANDLEFEWIVQAKDNNCDVFSLFDAADLKYRDKEFDGICTSPTYGNRMADSHEAKDESKRNTYTHSIGRKLHEENTGKMQWGEKYRNKHKDIYKEFYRILEDEGIFILNIKDHIRKGEVIGVSEFHKELITSIGFKLIKKIVVPVNGLGYGRNGSVRVDHENIFVFSKVSN